MTRLWATMAGLSGAMAVAVGASLQQIGAAAIGAVDLGLVAHVEIDARMAQRTAAAVAGHDGAVHGDGFGSGCFGGLHGRLRKAFTGGQFDPPDPR